MKGNREAELYSGEFQCSEANHVISLFAPP
jgi:hypothetical protein